jgi:hypothetical protein
MFDSGMPLGPGLLAIWVPLADPHTKNANARINAATTGTNVPAPILFSRSCFGMRFSFVSGDCLLLASAIGIAHFDSSGFRPIIAAVAGERGHAPLRRDQCQQTNHAPSGIRV